MSETQEDKMRKLGFVTVTEASEMSGRSTTTIYRWLEEGTVRSEKAAGKVYINLDSLKEWLGPLADAVPEDKA